MVDSRSRAGKKRVTPARSGTIRLTLVLTALVLVNCYVFLWRSQTSIPAVMEKAQSLGSGTGSAPLAVAPDAGTGTPAVAPSSNSTFLEGSVGKGDTVGKILKKNGIAAASADEVLRALAPVFDMKSLRPGQHFKIEKAPDGTVRSFELTVSKIKTVRLARDAGGMLVGVADQAETRVEEHAFAARIDHSLYASIKGAGEDTALVSFFVDAFAYDIDFYNDTQQGDTMRVIVEKVYKDQEFLHYGRIIAAEYAGRVGTFRVFFREADKRYYDASGRSIEKSMLKTPLKFTRISSGFDRHRMHPILHIVRGHMGVDYAAPIGTPVWAAASGTIMKRGPSGGAGNIVMIKHDDGHLVTQYMHLSKFASGQKIGQHVEAKTVIGYVGMTGLATGPHLHFGVIQDGKPVDPQKLTPTRARGVPTKELAAWKSAAAQMTQRLDGIAIAPPAAAPSDGDADDDAAASDAGDNPGSGVADDAATAHP